jgi:hypothetical protein
MTMAMTGMTRRPVRWGVRIAAEGFADRVYTDDGQLVATSRQDALITDPARAADQAVRMAMEGKVRTITAGDGGQGRDHLHPRRQPRLGQDRGRGPRGLGQAGATCDFRDWLPR